MGGFGECLEHRIRELWHYNTTFGSTGFNIAAIQINIIQLVATAVLLGIWHSNVTIEYIWWPAFECVRIFVLTLCRADVLLKDINDIRHNSRASSQTRKIIMLCNLIGAASMIIGGPIYLLLLPKYHTIMYWTFVATFLVLMVARILLTIPMFSALIYGTSMYRIIDGNNYERIDDERQRYATDPLLERDEPASMDQDVYDVPEDVIVAVEDLQLRRAIEESRRESRRRSDRSIREQQDREYQEALEQQRKLDEAQAKVTTNPLLGNENETLTSGIDYYSTNNFNSNNDLDVLVTDGSDVMHRSNSSISSASASSNSLQSRKSDEASIEREKQEARREILSALPPVGEEPSKSSDTVSVRICLPSGRRCTRRFKYQSTIKDIKNWVNHELVNNDNAELINEFDLITTMPRTVYDNESKTLKNLKFWRENAKRECTTPLLYVEENTVDNDESDSSEQ